MAFFLKIGLLAGHENKHSHNFKATIMGVGKQKHLKKFKKNFCFRISEYDMTEFSQFAENFYITFAC